ncbi:MAG TPA: hypothetical protein VGM53_35410 [Streptosporangiaceae bacterium]|jgi:hypothetical protein
MDLLVLLAIAWAAAYAAEHTKGQWRGTRDQHARSLAKRHTDWSPGRVRRHANRRAWSWAWHELRGGFPTARGAWAEDREHIRWLRENEQIQRDMRRGTLRQALEHVRGQRAAHAAAIQNGETGMSFGHWLAATGQEPGKAPAGSTGPKQQPAGVASGTRPALPPMPPSAPAAPVAAGTAPAAPAGQPGSTGGGQARPAGQPVPPASRGTAATREPAPGPGPGPGPGTAGGPQALPADRPAVPAPAGTTGTGEADGASDRPGVHRVGSIHEYTAPDGSTALKLAGWEWKDPATGDAVSGWQQDGYRLNGHTVAELHALSHGPGCTCSVSGYERQPIHPVPEPGTQGSSPAARNGTPASPGQTAGRTPNPSQHGGNTMPTGTSASSSMEAPNIEAARQAASQQAQHMQAAVSGGEQYANDLLAGGMGNDKATMAAVATAQEATANAAQAWQNVINGLNSHQQGEEYANTGRAAKTDFLQHA